VSPFVKTPKFTLEILHKIQFCEPHLFDTANDDKINVLNGVKQDKWCMLNFTISVRLITIKKCNLWTALL